MELLYRGVSYDTDGINGGKIRAKGDIEELEFMAGNSQVMAGNSFNTICRSQRNAMHAQNICSDTYKTTYVSFTTDLTVAEKFATENGVTDGYIYVVKVAALVEHGIEYFSQEAQVNDNEFEVHVNLAGFDYLPIFIILEKRIILV